MAESEFDVLEEQVLSGIRDPDYHAKGGRLSNDDKLYWFLDGMDELGYIAYHCEDVSYKRIADSLSLSAANQGLPAVPAELAQERTNQNLFIGNPDMLNADTAVRLIAALVSAWRVFVISDGTDGCYMGVVSHENAAYFVSCMSRCFSMVEHEYKIELLQAMPDNATWRFH